MRHKYETRGIVLARVPFGETHARLAIVTEELGLIWARATGVRSSKSKLAHALATLAESDLVLVAGREGWRVAGAVLHKNWFAHLPSPEAKSRAGRIGGLLLRLSPGEAPERRAFPIFEAYLAALAGSESRVAEGAELLAAEALLTAFGVGEYAVVPAEPDFAPNALVEALAERPTIVARINRGLAASGL